MFYKLPKEMGSWLYILIEHSLEKDDGERKIKHPYRHFFFCFFVFFEMEFFYVPVLTVLELMCRPGWPWTPRDPCGSALGLKVSANTTARLEIVFNQGSIYQIDLFF